MRPWRHALSSAKGGDWRADLPIHEFMDQTKAACADQRHRMVLHSVDIGGALAEAAFSERADVAAVVERHIVEDLGFACALGDWLAVCDLEKLPRPEGRRLALTPDDAVDILARDLPPEGREAALRVHRLLTLPRDRYGATALPVLMNSAGPAIIRQIMGPPCIAGPNTTDILDTAWVAEAMIMLYFGHIPDLSTVARSCRRSPVASEDAREAAR